METLETLSKFVGKYPQRVGRKLQYAFLGGTAIRLNQELVGYDGDGRQVTDFDVLVFDGKKTYPVHQCPISDVFGVISGTERELGKYVDSARVRDQDYYFMNGTFLALTKTCAVDCPREKDFNDVEFLYKAGLIDFTKLVQLYLKSTRLIKQEGLAAVTLKSLLDSKSPSKVRLFQTFPRLINLIGEFQNTEKAQEVVSDYVTVDLEKDGYKLASVVYDAHAFLRELLQFSEHDKLVFLAEILNVAKTNDYRDFSKMVHSDLIPRVRYSSSPKEIKGVLKR